MSIVLKHLKLSQLRLKMVKKIFEIVLNVEFVKRYAKKLK